MYRILIESTAFDGKSRVQQHQLVAEVLKDDLKTIHGFSLKTKVTEK
jgi:stress-induced morphogen